MALSNEDKELLILLESEELDKRHNFINHVFPKVGRLARHKYFRHLDFFRAGLKYLIRLFLAGNRVGKSFSGAYEFTCHMTGIYPDWWEGLKVYDPDTYWAGCFTLEMVTQGIQKAFLGESEPGTGLIPKNRIKYVKPRHHVAGSFELVEVWFGNDLDYAKKNNIYSTLVFKTYDPGYKVWTAAKVKGILLDELPPLRIFLEAKQRVITKNGFICLTFTPEADEGKALEVETLEAFFPDGDYTPGRKGEDKYVTFCSVYEAPHLTEDMIRKMMVDMPDYLQQAKIYGIPCLGQGSVFPVLRDTILCDPFNIPNDWPRAFGMDTGWVATAALFAAVDPNTKVIYVYAEYKEGQKPPELHARPIKDIRDRDGKFEEMIGCIDCHSQSKNTRGEQDFALYSELGLILFPSDGSANSVEPRILKVYDLLATGKLKIFNNLYKLIAEYNLFRRGKDGKPIKGNTINNGMHLIDCLLYLVNHSIDYASPVPDYTNPWDVKVLTIDTGKSHITGY